MVGFIKRELILSAPQRLQFRTAGVGFINGERIPSFGWQAIVVLKCWTATGQGNRYAFGKPMVAMCLYALQMGNILGRPDYLVN